MFAAANFTRLETAEPVRTALQDSALVRGRAMIDFLTHGNRKTSVYITDFYDQPDLARPQPPPFTQQWFGFISGRTSHLGKNREPDDDFDQWPDREPGQVKGEDRLDRLARLVLTLLRLQVDRVTPECRNILTEIADRAEAYLNDPSDERYRATDPANISA